MSYAEFSNTADLENHGIVAITQKCSGGILSLDGALYVIPLWFASIHEDQVQRFILRFVLLLSRVLQCPVEELVFAALLELALFTFGTLTSRDRQWCRRRQTNMHRQLH